MALDVHMTARRDLGNIGAEIVATAGQVDVRSAAAEPFPGLKREGHTINTESLNDWHALGLEEVPIGIEQIILLAIRRLIRHDLAPPIRNPSKTAGSFIRLLPVPMFCKAKRARQ